MRKSILTKLYVLMFCLGMISCKSKQKLTASSPKDTGIELEEKASANLKKVIAQQADFKTLSTRAATALSIKGKSYDVTMNIRIKKGEGIWVSVTYFAGIEVARALITPDSVKVMDKINNEYLKKPFSFVQKYSNEKIDYATLEAILVGNCIPFTLNNKRELSVEKTGLVINGNSDEIVYHVDFNSDLKPAYTTLKTTDELKNLMVNVDLFESIGSVLIPKKLNIQSVAGAQSIKLNMDYNKTVLNEPVDFPFNVSKRFSVID
ncbi:DUF4292 domain-containing protein [Pedobacter arcticus]|uniref:DUF4292 domain-containing protein n=1 Tax=Pedobacter arcticus TaxID=752140 RepID=UPI00036E5646|nr:DUF4292 domain-containing protein [Pedobacter arcticus]